jgi:hypothetical protein
MIMVIFAMLGKAITNALTATFKPSLRLISLNTLRILNILKVLRLFERGVRELTENMMIMKSKMFHDYLK